MDETAATGDPGHDRPHVGLFVTCLVDLYRPVVGFASAHLLKQAGCRVVVPEQTCCGQPAFNSGARSLAADLARRVIDAFADVDCVVVPSGSCAAMIRVHYPRLLADDPEYADRARNLAERTFELVQFLADQRGWRPQGASSVPGAVTLHDACSGLRELGIREQPRRLLRAIEGLTLSESADCEECCGFGGTFCVKYPEISTRMVDGKCDSIVESGARTLVAGDLGCLLNIAGRLARREDDVQARHIAELLAGMTDEPPIGVTGG